MFYKIDELETIMLGEDKNNPNFAWLKKKFDDLRDDCLAQQYVQRIAYGAGAAGFLAGGVVMLAIMIGLYGLR